MTMVRGFYVRNEKGMPFADWIADGIKRAETRTRRTLNALTVSAYRWGWTEAQMVYVIRTEAGKRPMVIGRCYLSEPYWCPAIRFHAESVMEAHKVPLGSKYDVTTGGKWLYDVWDAERVEPFPLPENVVRHGRSWVEFNLEEA